MSFPFFFAESTARMGLVHLVVLVERLICASHWGGETGSPPPKSYGFIFSGRGYFGGRGTAHHPLPHILEMAILLDSGYFGGGRIGTSPFLLTLPVCTSEGEGQAFSLTSTTSYLGGGGTGPPPQQRR